MTWFELKSDSAKFNKKFLNHVIESLQDFKSCEIYHKENVKSAFSIHFRGKTFSYEEYIRIGEKINHAFEGDDFDLLWRKNGDELGKQFSRL